MNESGAPGGDEKDALDDAAEDERDELTEDDRPQLPDWSPGGSGLGEVLRMEEVEAEYDLDTRTFAEQSLLKGFVLRLFGGAFSGPAIDSIMFADALARWGRATAWANNALFQRRTVPIFESAAAISSVVVRFRGAPEETPQSNEVLPTATSARWLAGLLETDESEILKAAEILRPRATGTYLRALQDVANYEAGLEWLLLDERRPQRVVVPHEQVVETIGVIDQPVDTRRRRVEATGVLWSADQYRHRFKMDVTGGELKGRTIQGSYGEEASETLAGAWRQAVDVVLRATEPERPGLPRAPHTTYELLRVQQIRTDVQVPAEPEQLALSAEPSP